MRFLHPEMLWGLTALTIPVIVHLFHFRKFKKIYFPQTAFLQALMVQTQKTSQLKHILVLLARLLALLFLILAFAQPTFDDAQHAVGQKSISVYIDNSASMQAQKEGNSLLELAKNHAIEALNAVSENDRIQILTNDFTGLQQHALTKEKAIEKIASIQNCPIPRSAKEIEQRQVDFFKHMGRPVNQGLWISDFQQATMKIDNWNPSPEVQYRFLPIQNKQTANVYVDSIWFESPVHALQQPDQIHVILRNSGDEDKMDVRCEIKINDQSRNVTTVTIPAQSSAETVMTFTPLNSGFQQGQIVLDDYPIIFDNRFYFSYQVAESQPVTIYTTGESFLAAALKTEPKFKLTISDPRQFSLQQFQNADLVILESLENVSDGLVSTLKDWIAQGGSCAFVPAGNMNLEQAKRLVEKWNVGKLVDIQNNQSTPFQGKTLDFNHPLYKDVFTSTDGFNLPYSRMRWNIQLDNSVQRAVAFEDGSPLLISTHIGNGNLYLYTIPISTQFSNLSQHSLLPFTTIRMAECSGMQIPLYHFLGEKKTIQVPSSGEADQTVIQMKHTQSNITVIPLSQNILGRTELSLSDHFPETGLYQIQNQEQIIAYLGMNANKSESNLKEWNEEQFSVWKEQHPNVAWLQDLNEGIASQWLEINNNNYLWKYALLMALAFLALEILLIVLWKK